MREAYQDVAIVHQRDPVLVTTCGPDRVLVQCFPVPPNGQMKVRVGITAPLIIDDPSTGALALPRIVEQNFDMSSNVKHAVLAGGENPGDRRHAGLEYGAHCPGEGQAVRG